MKKLFLLSLAAAGMLATSCNDYNPLGEDLAHFQYRKEFVKAFGDIDPNHTWNTAEQRSMEFQINVPGTFNLRIFTTNPKNAETKSELLANYTNGGQGYESGDSYTISFDCPSGLRKVWADIQYVGSQRHIIQQVEIDADGHGMAVFGEDGTRATVYTSSNILDGKNVVKATGKKEIFSKLAYTGHGDDKSFMQVIPEQVENTHKEEVHTDFVYVSTGQPYKLYPIYIFTGADVSIGIQYRPDNESDWDEANEITMMTTQAAANDRITRLFSQSANGRTAINSDSPYSSPHSGFSWTVDNYDGAGNVATAAYWDGGQHSGNAKWATLYDTPDFVGTLCDEIEINLPTGYEFRFWVKQDLSSSGKGILKRYSDRESNSDKLSYFGTFDNKHKHNDQNVLYLGVEDWTNAVHDINDIVFAFVGAIPTIVDEGGPHYLDAEYLIAYEDMGTNDFDFNDIVVGVQHVSGRTTADVNIHACGGTLPVYLGFDDHDDPLNRVTDTYISLFSGKELHKALGGDDAPYDTPINVSGARNDKVDRSVMSKATYQMTVPETFSIVNKAQCFKLRVVQDVSQGITEDKATTEITVPSIGSTNLTPQAFVISYTGWEWPTENSPINVVYPEFEQWIARHTGDEGKAWYCPIWSGLDDFSSNVDYSVTLRPDYEFEYCLKTRDEIGSLTTISISKENEIATHDNGHLLDNNTFVMAFVVTNRQPDTNATVTIYKNSATQENYLGSVHFNGYSTTSTHSSYGEADKILLDVNSWNDITDIVVVFDNEHDERCVLNSIWAASPHKNIKMLDYEDLLVGNTVYEYSHDESCNYGANCKIENHISQRTVPAKLTKVGDQIEVSIASASSNRPYFLVCYGDRISHQGTMAEMLSNAQAIATTSSSKARFILKVEEITNEEVKVSIRSKNQIEHGNATNHWYLNAVNNTTATWSTNMQTFTICRATGGSRGSCIQGWDDDDMFRIKATNGGNYLNADGPQFKNGIGEWSLWYMFEIINN